MAELLKSDSFCIHSLLSDADWDIFKKTLSLEASKRDFEKIKNYLNPFAKSVVIEYNYVCKDYRDSFQNFYSKQFKEYKSKCLRLHFFNTEIAIDKLWSLEDNYKDNYIGYIVLRPLERFSIGRTILNPELLNVDANIVTCENEVNLFGSKFKIKAFPSMEQDTDVTVCAHAAMWMILRYFSQKYPYYKEIYPYQISKLTTDVSLGRPFPSKGLNISQISEIFSNYGMYPDLYMRDCAKDFDKLMYYYIESGIPLVACINDMHRHVVAMFGHHADFDYAGLKEYDYKGLKYFNSADLIKGYVINDDNHLPYKYLMRNTENGDRFSKYLMKEIDGFVAPLYEKIFISADAIEAMALGVLVHPVIGFHSITKKYKSEKLILRIFLTSSRSYKYIRRRNPIYEGIEKVYIELPMPKFIWVVELSLVDKYKDKKIIGEIIFDSTANKNDAFAFMVIHYPGILIINDRNKTGVDTTRFTISDIDLAKVSDYGMYISNLKK